MPVFKTTRRAFIALGSTALARHVLPSTALAPPAAAQSSPAELTGRVIRPGDADYEEARLDFNLRFSRFPSAIVACSDVRDVQNAVRWARQEGVPLRARSGGHSYEAYSVLDDGLVIDVGGLNEITVDPARGEAVVGAGVRLLDLYRRLWDFGVVIPAGTCPRVGIAGLTLGGGIGFLSRQHGLTCDNLLAVDLVDAAGETLRASEREHPDLFWALRGGGGGNFGIATSFTFRIHPIGDVAMATVTWPWDDVAVALDTWQRWAPFVDERLAAGFVVPEPSAGYVVATAMFNGPADELPALLAPLLGTGTPSAPGIRTLPWLDAATEVAGTEIAHSTFKNTGAFVSEPLPQEAIATLVDGMRASPTGANMVGFFPAGGAVGAVAPEATAFVHRRAHFDMQIQAYWWDESEAEADIAWARDLRAAFVPYTDGDYVNYIDADISDWATAYYGSNLPRLRRVKATYDPDDVFNGPQSIPLPHR